MSEWNTNRGFAVVLGRRLVRRYPELQAQFDDLVCEIETAFWEAEANWDGRYAFTTLASAQVRRRTREIVTRLTGRQFRGPKGGPRKLETTSSGAHALPKLVGDAPNVVDGVINRESVWHTQKVLRLFCTPSQHEDILGAVRHSRFIHTGAACGYMSRGMAEYTKAHGMAGTRRRKHAFNVPRAVAAKIDGFEKTCGEILTELRKEIA